MLQVRAMWRFYRQLPSVLLWQTARTATAGSRETCTSRIRRLLTGSAFVCEAPNVELAACAIFDLTRYPESQGVPVLVRGRGGSRPPRDFRHDRSKEARLRPSSAPSDAEGRPSVENVKTQEWARAVLARSQRAAATREAKRLHSENAAHR
jgi:hypothetical protein